MTDELKTKKKKTAKKKTATKKSASDGKQGRTSQYAGKKLHKLGTLKDGHILNDKGESMGRLRETGFTRECWDAIKNGQTVDTYRAATSDPSIARKVLADFIAKGYVEVVD